MSYLPDLHRILVEGAARIEHAQAGAGAEPAAPAIFSRARLRTALRRLTRRRLFIFAGAGLLASGSAAAALVALNGLRSAPPNGSISTQTGAGRSLQLATGSYSVSVTPDLLGGSVGWCVTERDRESTPLPVGDVQALRLELLRRRAQLRARLSGREGSLTSSSRAALAQEVDIVIPRLLSLLSRPLAARTSPAFQNAYRALYGVSGAGASDCGVAAQRGSPIVADFSQSNELGGAKATLISTTTLVLLTAPEVAAVRVSPTLTLLTRADKQLPDGERIAIAVQQAVGRKTALGSGSGAPTAVALDRQGKPIRVTARTARLGEEPVFWQAKPAGRGSSGTRLANAPPPGACEINTSTLAGSTPEYGTVVQRIRGFPQLNSDDYLSCADTAFTYHGQAVLAAILLDAQHPGAAPAAFPDASLVSQHPRAFSLTATPAGGSQSISARRIGDAWLVIQANGSVRERVALLAGLGTCVRTVGRCP
jgi:hypothetical protein